MTVYWFLLAALAAVGVFQIRCDHVAEQDKWAEDTSVHGSVFGFRPCIDESCESYAPETPGAEGSDYESHGTNPNDYIEENPRVHCIMLRPSAVNIFSEIERMHPGISDLKYRVLEELIDHMYHFATLELEGCQPAMKLVDLIILAANSLKTTYVLHGGENCTYTDKGEYVPGNGVTEVPCSSDSTETSGYVTGTSTLCPGSTVKPHVEIPPTSEVPILAEEPCLHGAEPCYKPPITKEPVQKPCPDGMSSEYPCHPAVNVVTEEYSDSSEVEVIVEDEESHINIPFVGSVRGIPGEHYPNYSEIPITSFTCADKKYIPGFYADLETGCQVFHVCYEHRRESFLCPVGTIFNQPILACDYWYSSNCSLAPDCYDVNEKTELKEEKIDVEVAEILTGITENEKSSEDSHSDMEIDLDKITPFFPVKAVVTDIQVPVKSTAHATEEFASEIVDEMARKATKIVSSSRDIVKSIPEPVQPQLVLKPVVTKTFPVLKRPMKMEELLAAAVVPLAKAKLAAIPVSKVTALKTAVPVASLAAKAKISIPVAAAKAKLATKVAAIPAIKVAATAPLLAKTKMIPAAKVAVAAPIIAKTKMAAIPAAKVAVAAPIIAKTKMAAIPVAKVSVAAPVIAKVAAVPIAAKVASVVPKVAVKSSIPILKAKMVASAIPLAKSKIIPLIKAKSVKGATTPLLKAKMLALPLAKSKLAGPVPLAKVKLAKAAAISPLTKKALALGYMKLLKAKKIALMG